MIGMGDDGGGGPGQSRALVAALAAASAVLVVAIGVVIALIRVDGASETGPAAVPTDSTTTRSASTTTRPSPRPTSSVAPVPTAARQRGAVCDALVINADLGYPDSGARIIDCGAGWAVMASEISGDPFWVAYRGGRWQSVRDVSIYQSTCPDEAIARGAPAWMAIKHLGPCPTATPCKLSATWLRQRSAL